MTLRRHFFIATSVLRARYRDLIRPFVSDIEAFSHLLRTHGAVISGSLALFYLIPSDQWFPNDMDVYVPYSTYNAFTATLESHPGLRFVLEVPRPDSLLSTSETLDIVEIRKYRTPSNRLVDVIRSRRDSPLSPLLRYWTSLLVNYISPDGFASAFPRMLFNGTGYCKEFGMTTRDNLAMEKYTARHFRKGVPFAFFPDIWGTWKDPLYWTSDCFADRQALVIDFRRDMRTPVPPLPLRCYQIGWKFVIPYPPRAYAPFIHSYRATDFYLSRQYTSALASDVDEHSPSPRLEILPLD